MVKKARKFSNEQKMKAIRSGVSRMEYPYKTWICLICGWCYDEEKGCTEEGIAPAPVGKTCLMIGYVRNAVRVRKILRWCKSRDSSVISDHYVSSDGYAH